ncbi:MAG: thioredoxin domain-containing protein [Pyrinomonadaceae bacterium]|nr:thioredoxin domain-containing protein [Pyrinomonadaceae bacterium]
MRNFVFIISAVIFAASAVLGQAPEKPVATAKGITITASQLPPDARRAIENLSGSIAATRTQILSVFLADQLLDTEAKSRKLSVEQLQNEALKTVADPSNETIQVVYDANKEALGNSPLSEVRSQIVSFLRREPEQNALESQVADLQKKYAFKFVKDVNAVDLKATDVLATFGTRSITAQEFEEKNKIALYDSKAHIYDDIRAAVEEALLNTLIVEEARSQNMDSADLIAREITNKLRDYSEEERLELQDALQRRLFTKYAAKIDIGEPAPLVLNVSADDDPSVGNANAPVTIVMFSDFQCPACARTHPVLKRVIAEYGDKVRLVVRDFPLESIHTDAFQAALAANAVRAQGKYIEFIEILYKNQETLDGESLLKHAATLDVDTKKMTADIASPSAAAEIRKDMADGAAYGVGGTPTIFVNGVKVHRLSAPAFRAAIDRALAK